jgi:hypothetical protein
VTSQKEHRLVTAGYKQKCPFLTRDTAASHVSVYINKEEHGKKLKFIRVIKRGWDHNSNHMPPSKMPQY